MTLYIDEVDIDHRMTQKKLDVFNGINGDARKVEDGSS